MTNISPTEKHQTLKDVIYTNYCGIETDYNEIEKAVKEWLEKQPWVTSEDIQVELNSIEETGEGYEEIANKQWIRRDKLLEALSL